MFYFATTQVRMLAAFSRHGPEVLLNTLRCTEQPLSRRVPRLKCQEHWGWELLPKTEDCHVMLPDLCSFPCSLILISSVECVLHRLCWACRALEDAGKEQVTVFMSPSSEICLLGEASKLEGEKIPTHWVQWYLLVSKGSQVGHWNSLYWPSENLQSNT